MSVDKKAGGIAVPNGDEGSPCEAKTIGLVGWYWRGNFGDDLMAVLYALRLQHLGFKVLVWQLSAKVANEYGLEISNEMDGVVNRSDVIVYGGGGLFTNAHREMERMNGFGEAMERLCALVRLKRIPLLLSSVGGDGDATVLSKAQVALIETASLVTLRNEEDTGWFSKFDRHPHVYPDIIWRVPIDLDIQQTPVTDTVVVQQCGRLEELALQVAVAAVQRKARPTRLLSICCERASDTEPSLFSVTYDSLRELLELLQRTQLVFTHRLHLGMTVLAMGGRVIAVRPEIKTRLVYERIGLSASIVRKRRGVLPLFRHIWRILNHSAALQLSSHKRAELAQGADQHIGAIIGFMQGSVASIRSPQAAAMQVPEPSARTTV